MGSRPIHAKRAHLLARFSDDDPRGPHLLRAYADAVRHSSGAAVVPARATTYYVFGAMRVLLSGGHVRARDRAFAGAEAAGLSRGLESTLRHSIPIAVVYVLHAPR